MALYLINILSFLITVKVAIGQNGERFLYNGGFGFDLITTTSLNQDSISFKREIELSHVLPLGYQLQDALKTYREICRKYYGDANLRKQVKYNAARSFYGLNNNVSYTLGVTTSFFSPGLVNIPNANKSCMAHNARLPEFRRNVQNTLQKLCIKHDLTSIPVNVQFSNPKLLFPSDQSYVAYNPFKQVEIRTNVTNVAFSLGGTFFPEYVNIIPTLTPMVDDCHTDRPVLRYYQPNEFDIQANICEIDNPSNAVLGSSSTDVMYSWLDIACNHELDSTTEQIKSILHEVTTITNFTFAPHRNLNITSSKFTRDELLKNLKVDLAQQIPKFPQDSFTEPPPNIRALPKRPSRNVLDYPVDDNFLNEKMQAASIGEALQVIGWIDLDAFTQEIKKLETIRKVVPTPLILDLELAYHIKKPFYDLLTTDWEPLLSMFGDAPALATIDQLGQIANGLTAVVINQEQIEGSIKQLESSTVSVQNKLNEHMYTSALYTATQDVKQNIQSGIQIITSFLSKLANILIGAQLGKTSIYALNKLELDEIARKVRQSNNDVILTKHLSEVTTTIVHDGFSHLVLIIDIPVTNKHNLFNIYQVFPVPKFGHNQTFLPHYEFSNLAVSVTNEYYTMLSDLELTKCMHTPNQCRTVYPLALLNDTVFHCIISSFVHDTLSCPLQLTHETPQPFLYFSDLQLVYSVPELTHIHNVCILPNSTMVKFYSEISNTGMIPLRPNCKMVFTCDQYRLIRFTPTKARARYIADWPTFDNLKLKFANKNVTVLLPNEIVSANLNLTITKINVPTWTQLLNEAFYPKRTLPTLLQYVVAIILLTFTFLALKICHSCGLCQLSRYRFCRTNRRRPLPPVPQEDNNRTSTDRHTETAKTPTSNTAETRTHRVRFTTDLPSTTTCTAEQRTKSPDIRQITAEICKPDTSKVRNTLYSPFKPITLLEMNSISDSLTNLSIGQIEENAFTPPLPKKMIKPSLKSIDEHYVEMAPLLTKTDEKPAGSDTIVVINNVKENPIYSVPSPKFRPRFALSPTLQKSMEQLDLDRIDTQT